MAALNHFQPTATAAGASFADVGATVAEWFALDFRGRGTSFLREILA